jgi:hypothetical protein
VLFAFAKLDAVTLSRSDSADSAEPATVKMFINAMASVASFD